MARSFVVQPVHQWYGIKYPRQTFCQDCPCVGWLSGYAGVARSASGGRQRHSGTISGGAWGDCRTGLLHVKPSTTNSNSSRRNDGSGAAIGPCQSQANTAYQSRPYTCAISPIQPSGVRTRSRNASGGRLCEQGQLFDCFLAMWQLHSVLIMASAKSHGTPLPLISTGQAAIVVGHGLKAPKRLNGHPYPLAADMGAVGPWCAWRASPLLARRPGAASARPFLRALSPSSRYAAANLRARRC